MDYTAVSGDEVSLSMLDTCTILDRKPGFFQVDANGVTGWVPASHLSESPPHDTVELDIHGTVLCDYDKSGANEISVRRGDAVKVKVHFQHWQGTKGTCLDAVFRWRIRCMKRPSRKN